MKREELKKRMKGQLETSNGNEQLRSELTMIIIIKRVGQLPRNLRSPGRLPALIHLVCLLWCIYTWMNFAKKKQIKKIFVSDKIDRDRKKLSGREASSLRRVKKTSFSKRRLWKACCSREDEKKKRREIKSAQEREREQEKKRWKKRPDWRENTKWNTMLTEERKSSDVAVGVGVYIHLQIVLDCRRERRIVFCKLDQRRRREGASFSFFRKQSTRLAFLALSLLFFSLHSLTLFLEKKWLTKRREEGRRRVS